MRSFSSFSISALVSCGCLFLFGCDAGSSSSPGGSGGVSAGSGGSAVSGAGNAAQGGSLANAGNPGVAGATAAAGNAAGGALGQAGVGGATPTAGSAGWSAGAGSGDCTGALICDDFESYTGTPGGPWKVTKTSFGTVSIDGTQHRSGTKAVKFATSGGMPDMYTQLAYISVEKIFPIASNTFYGRMMFYVTKAANDGVHWTNIEAEGPAQGISNAMVRYGGQNEQRLMANYDTVGKSSDCWQHSATKIPESKWMCIEWFFDGGTNTQKFWLDGQSIADLTVTDAGEGCLKQDTGGKWIYPSFTRLNLGWGSYVKDDPREAWIDDVAIDTKKIGCPQ